MQLKAVRIQNFLSVESAVVDFSGRGTTLVVGPTGCGKSAMLVEPLLWQWYDMLNRPASRSQMAGVKRRYRQRPVDDLTSVETWFSQSGHDYYVKRTLEKGWEISKDGAAVTPYKVKADGVAAMGQVIGLPSHLFRSIAVMGQGFQERFTGFRDSDRTTVIEDFLGAAAYEKGQDEAKQAAQAADGVLRSLSAERQSLAYSVEETEKQITAAESHLSQVASAGDAARLELETEAGALGAERGQLQAASEELGRRASELNDQIRGQEAAESTANGQVAMEHRSLGSLDGALASVQGARQKLVDLGDKCPTCLQAVDGRLVQSEVLSLDQQLADLASQRSEAERFLGECRLHLDAVRQQTRELRSQSQQVRQQLNDCQKRISEIDGRYATIQSTLSGLSQREIDAEAVLRNLRSRLSDERNQLESVVARESLFDSVQPYLSWWVEGFSVRGIRSKRLGGVLETMNVKLAHYCEALFDGEFMVRLLPVKPQKTANAKSTVSIDVSGPASCYEMASGGQERCIDLAIHFALRGFAQNAAFGWSSNFLIGDEVFDHLDRRLSERALDVLRSEADRIFLVTHSPELQALCDSTWRVSREDECTCLRAV